MDALREIDESGLVEILSKETPSVVFVVEKKSKVLEELVNNLKRGSEYASYVSFFTCNFDDSSSILDREKAKEARKSSKVVAVFLPPIQEPVIFSFANPEELESFYVAFINFLKRYFTGEIPGSQSSREGTPGSRT